jgi:hypothetical protein
MGSPGIQRSTMVSSQTAQKFFDGFLTGAHFLDDHEAVTNFLLQEVSVGYNETKCKSVVLM